MICYGPLSVLCQPESVGMQEEPGEAVEWLNTERFSDRALWINSFPFPISE